MKIPGDYLRLAYNLPKPGERLNDQLAGDTVWASALVTALRQIGAPVEIHEASSSRTATR